MGIWSKPSAIALILASFVLSKPLPTAAYEPETVTFVTHSSPGGGSDVLLRELARFLEPQLNISIVVENVRGGSGAAAMADVAQSAPDGSRFYATTPTFVFTSLLSNPQFTYADLLPVANLFADPSFIYTAADSGFSDLADVIEFARQNRGIWGASNPASSERQALEKLKAAAKVDASIVTHDGGGALLINVLNSTLHIGVGEIQEIQSQLLSGDLRLLATLSEERVAAFPDVPTVTEFGYSVSFRKFRGIAGPKGLPQDVLDYWQKAFKELLDTPAFQDAYESKSLEPYFMGTEDYKVFISDFALEARTFLIDSGLTQ